MKSIEHDYNHNQQMIHQMMVNSYYLKLLHSYIMEDKNKQNTVLGMDYPNMIKEEYYLKKVDFPIVQVDISTCQGRKNKTYIYIFFSLFTTTIKTYTPY